MTDTLHESILIFLRQSPFHIFKLIGWLCLGRLRFKQNLAQAVTLDPLNLPYNQPLLQFLQKEKERGCSLILASAADDLVVQGVAKHLTVFTDAFGSTTINLKADQKLKAIRDHARINGYTKWRYAGNASTDKAIWNSECEQAIIANAPAKLVREVVAAKLSESVVFPAPVASFQTWLRAIRLIQWSKNALLFVPLLAAHSLSGPAWGAVAMAFVAFGLCASATYLVNDLLDLNYDRKHKTKSLRPLAGAQIELTHAVLAVICLLAISAGLAISVSLKFASILLLYTMVTLSYSLALKKIALADVMTLSILYAIRIVAGALVAHVALSNWLLAISIFLFLSLALAKRCAELEELNALIQNTDKQALGRGYLANDLASLRSMGIASGFLSVMVFALYVDSQNSQTLYAQAQWLWAIAPVLLLWVMRLWLKTGRRELVGEDPLLFALKDPYSWVSACVVGVFALLASS